MTEKRTWQFYTASRENQVEQDWDESLRQVRSGLDEQWKFGVSQIENRGGMQAIFANIPTRNHINTVLSYAHAFDERGRRDQKGGQRLMIGAFIPRHQKCRQFIDHRIYRTGAEQLLIREAFRKRMEIIDKILGKKNISASAFVRVHSGRTMTIPECKDPDESENIVGTEYMTTTKETDSVLFVTLVPITQERRAIRTALNERIGIVDTLCPDMVLEQPSRFNVEFELPKWRNQDGYDYHGDNYSNDEWSRLFQELADTEPSIQRTAGGKYVLKK